MKSSPAEPPVEVASQESADWLEMMWTFAASMVAPDDEDEEGIQQLTEPLTCKKANHLMLAPLTKITNAVTYLSHSH